MDDVTIRQDRLAMDSDFTIVGPIKLSAEEVAWLNACGFTPGVDTDADVWPFPSETILRKLWASVPAAVDAS